MPSPRPWAPVERVVAARASRRRPPSPRDRAPLGAWHRLTAHRQVAGEIVAVAGVAARLDHCAPVASARAVKTASTGPKRQAVTSELRRARPPRSAPPKRHHGPDPRAVSVTSTTTRVPPARRRASTRRATGRRWRRRPSGSAGGAGPRPPPTTPSCARRRTMTRRHGRARLGLELDLVGEPLARASAGSVSRPRRARVDGEDDLRRMRWTRRLLQLDGCG